MEEKKRQQKSVAKWLGGVLLAIGIILMLVGGFVHEGGYAVVFLRTYLTLGVALVICSIITLLAG